jgi:pimeloyl-ACP methyl ester carboxylesterase
VREPLSQSHRVIAVDLPSFGLSSKPRREYTSEFFVATLLELFHAAQAQQSSSINAIEYRDFQGEVYLLGLRRSRWREPRFFRRCVKRMGVPVKSNLARS